MKFFFDKYRKHIYIFIYVFLAIILIAFLGSALNERFHNQTLYETAINQIHNGEYQSAIEILKPLKNFKDTKKYISYAEALVLFEDGYTQEAIDMLCSLGDFEDSQERVKQIQTISQQVDEQAQIYQEAMLAYSDGDYQKTIELLEKIGNYKDSEQIKEVARVSLWRLVRSNTLAAGIQCSAGVTENGTVLFSGQNFAGESEIREWEDIVSVSASNEFLVGLKNDGTVVTAKRKLKYGYRIDTNDWTDIISVSVGEQFIVGLRKDGTLTAQGIDGYGETDIDDWTDIVAIDTGWQHTVGLDRNGQVHITGFHSQQLLKEIENHKDEWCNIVDIATGGCTAASSKGSGHIVALKQDGTVVAVGDNTYGQCNVSEWTDIIAIAAGDYHTVGLKRDGTVLTTQTGAGFRESYSTIEQWNHIVSVAAGYGFTLALCVDGTVKAAGLDQNGQCNVIEWKNIQNRYEWNLIFERNLLDAPDSIKNETAENSV